MIPTNFRGAMGHALDSFLYKTLLKGLTVENLTRMVEETLKRHVDQTVQRLLVKFAEDIGFSRSNYNLDQALYVVVLNQAVDVRSMIEISVKEHLILTEPQKKRLRTLLHHQIRDQAAKVTEEECLKVVRTEAVRIYDTKFSGTILTNIRNRLQEMGLEVPAPAEPTEETAE
jgi:hypothetical protein